MIVHVKGYIPTVMAGALHGEFANQLFMDMDYSFLICLDLFFMFARICGVSDFQGCFLSHKIVCTLSLSSNSNRLKPPLNALTR